MIKTIQFEIETITPMFLSGADQGKAELRAASIKGLMRFWWRALQAEGELEKLRDRENRIFGSADEKMGGGSSFSIRIRHDNLQPVSKKFPFKDNIHKIMVTSRSRNKTFPINILEYLAYGPFDPKRKSFRPYFDAKAKFTLIISVLNAQHIDEVLKALHYLALFGGVGSRSRNGFGSLAITKAEGNFNASRIISPTIKYSDDVLKELANRKSALLPYSSFTQGTRLFCTKEKRNSWDEALADAGQVYRGIRVGDIKLNNEIFEKKHNYNKRQFLGAPLDPFQENYHSLLDRHAKPYFIKVAKEGSQYRSYILYLPSLYCYGLDEDRNKNRINNHDELNKKFIEVCNEFNEFLGKYMETIL